MEQYELLLSLILFLTFTLSSIKSNEIYENSTDICTRCSCTKSNDSSNQVVILNCANQAIRNILSNWPPHNNTLSATFSNNNFTTLEKLPPSDATIEVVFSNCCIKYLDPAVFDAVKNIIYVDLSHNLLTSEELSSDKFKGPYNNTQFEPIALKHLNLAYNHIHSLAKNIFEHLPNLQILNIEGNQLKVLDIHTQLALSSISKLQSLNLANNKLTELVEDAISNCKHLTELNLSKNDLDYVPHSLGRIGESLEKLILDENPILEMDDNTFLGLTNIIEISANNLTELKLIHSNAFVPVSKLRKLSLSNNMLLTHIDREAFGIDPIVEQFYLNNNRLYQIDYELLPWKKLRIFEFNDNPLDCSCDLYNISTSLSNEITTHSDGPRCLDPRSGKSTPVFHLTSDICLMKSYPIIGERTIPRHFTLFRLTLVGMSIVLIFSTFVAATLGYTRFRKFQRNRNYPFASQVLYNPLSTHSRF